MTDEFLSLGLEADRYLKAVRLAEQFETSIEARLRQIGQRMVAENPDLFETGVDGREDDGTDTNSVLAYARIDYPMDRVRGLDDEKQLKLDVHLYWVEPEQYARTDIGGALRALGYKIKYAPTEDREQVARETRDRPLETAEDPFKSDVVYYDHVSSAEDLNETAEQLVEHFSVFGNEFGVPRDS